MLLLLIYEVRIFGTENREAEMSVPPTDDIYEYIVFAFPAQIKSINAVNVDPSSSQNPYMGAQGGMMYPPYSYPNYIQQNYPFGFPMGWGFPFNQMQNMWPGMGNPAISPTTDGNEAKSDPIFKDTSNPVNNPSPFGSNPPIKNQGTAIASPSTSKDKASEVKQDPFNQRNNEKYRTDSSQSNPKKKCGKNY
jgi:hypothetical protein